MNYLTEAQVRALNPQRRRALLVKVKALVGKHIDEYFDFEPDRLVGGAKRLNNYRKMVQRLQ